MHAIEFRNQSALRYMHIILALHLKSYSDLNYLLKACIVYCAWEVVIECNSLFTQPLIVFILLSLFRFVSSPERSELNGKTGSDRNQAFCLVG